MEAIPKCSITMYNILQHEIEPSTILNVVQCEQILSCRCFCSIHSAFPMSTRTKSILSGKLFAWLIAWVLAQSCPFECDHQRIPDIPETHRETQVTPKHPKTHPADPCPSPGMYSLGEKTPSDCTRMSPARKHTWTLSIAIQGG